MAKQSKQSALKQLRQIPGIGKIISDDLWNMGIHSLDDLKGHDPDQLYEKLCDFKASTVDRCMLYVFRCAVYYTSNTTHDPQLLKWWNWKDKN